jgi:hypothetical protein
MNGVVSVVLGVLALMVVIAWIAVSLGIGEQFVQPLIAFFGYPVIRLTRVIAARRRERSIRRLPPGVPPPPDGP